MALILEISQILVRQWFLLVLGSLTNVCSADVSNQRGSKQLSFFVCAHKCTQCTWIPEGFAADQGPRDYIKVYRGLSGHSCEVYVLRILVSLEVSADEITD